MSPEQDYIVRCPSCRSKNRIPASRTQEHPKCGKCGAAIPLDGVFEGRPEVVTDRNFEQAVLASPLPVLLDCWAPWCGPCRMVGPIIDQLAAEWRGRIKAGKLNVDENPASSARFNIRSIPTLLVFDGGQLKHTMVGALPKDEIVRQMAPFL